MTLKTAINITSNYRDASAYAASQNDNSPVSRALFKEAWKIREEFEHFYEYELLSSIKHWWETEDRYSKKIWYKTFRKFSKVHEANMLSDHIKAYANDLRTIQ